MASLLLSFASGAARTSQHVSLASTGARYIAQRAKPVASPTTLRPRNEKIPFPVVSLVDAETGALHPPQSLKSIIASIEDPKAFHVELVSETPSPIVKIIDTKAALLKYKEKKKHDREVARAQAHKEVQLTWGVASGDLAHKLNKVRQELAKGRRVDLIFAPKKGQTIPTKQGMETLLKEALDSLADVGKEYLPREERKNIIALYLKPIPPPQS